MNKKQYFVYMATSKINIFLHTGATNNIIRRMHEHKNKLVSSFSSKYNINKLVYYEVFDNVNQVIRREK
jgi:putative endonuclease